MKVVIAGVEVALGVTEVSPTIGMTDFSRRETDDFGVTTVVPRGFARRMSVRFAVPFEEVDGLQQQLAALRATPTRWIADNRFAWLNFEGFYKDFNLDLAMPPTSFCTLTVEGLAETETVADAGGDPAPEGRPSSLHLLHPAAVADAELVSSSVPEADHGQWSALTTYPAGARVLKAPSHRIYESVANGNVGNDPLGASGKWIDIGPTNRWAMFDQALGTSTTAVGLITVTLDVAGVNAVALLDSSATSVRVQAAGYDQTQAVGPGTVAFLDLPETDGQVTITIEAPGALSVGTLIVGRGVPLGVTEAAPTAGINDFSRKEFDDFGEPIVVERAWAKRMSARALIRTDAIDLVANRIAAVRARPSLWIGDANVDSLVVYGFFRDFSIEVGENVSTVSLSIEGLSKAVPAPPYVPPPYPGATPGAPDGSPIGGTLDPQTGEVEGGRPAEEVIDQIDQIEATSALTAAELAELSGDVDAAEAELAGALTSISDLDRARVASEAAARQLGKQVSEGADALLRTVVEGWKTRRRMRDAGITVDPVTGIVSIRAVEDTRERLSEAEIRLNAAENSILLRATTTYVDEQIAQAVIDPSQIPELGGLQIRMGAAEVAIDGLEASIVLKASAASLDALTFTVTELGTQYDALEGTITTKAEKTVVDVLGARVGAVETVISTLGNVSSIITTIRQARFVAQDTAEATLKGLLAQHAAGKLRRKQIAEVRSEAYAKIDEGLLAEAARREILSAEVGAASAAIAVAETARIEGDHANATAIESVAATLAGVEDEVAAEVARLDAADATETAARAAAIDSVRAEIGDLSATVTDLVEVVVTPTGANAKAISEIDVGGRVLGFYRTNDGTRTATVFRTDKFGLVDPDTNEQYFGVDDAGAYFRNISIQMFGPGGTAMKVTGVGFGSSNQFIEWFGPTMPLSECSEANGTYWLKLNGSAYFGGTLTAGARKNAQQTTELVEDARVVVGPFGTAGGLKVVTLSYSYLRERVGPSPGVSGTTSATVVLEKLEGGFWTIKATLDVSGSNFVQPPSEPGAYDGSARTEMAGSLTWTDNAAGTDDISYRGRILTRTVATLTGASPHPDIHHQNVSVMSIEE